MVSHSFLKFCIISFLTYLQISVLYNSNYTLWAGFEYDDHEYRYTVFVPSNDNDSNMIISACQDNTCKVLRESPYLKITWIELFEREFHVHFKNDTLGNYDNLMNNFTSGFNITIENPNSYMGMIMGFCLFIAFI